MTPSFRDGLKNVLDFLGNNRDKLVTFMSDSLAKRLDDAAFLEVIKELYEILDENVDKLVNLVVGGVAARITNPLFMKRVRKLKEKFGLDSTVTFVQEAASRLLGDKFYTHVNALEALPTSSSDATPDKIVPYR